jgi:hypothetical protein
LGYSRLYYQVVVSENRVSSKGTKMILAPIVLFVYDRPWHTRQTVEALKRNTLAMGSDLIVFSDGARESAASKEKVAAVRDYLASISGFKTVGVVSREKNYGLGRSIVDGVSRVVEEHGRIIVLEDDIVTSRFFLEYLNQGLNLYENDDDVISIHSYIYPVGPGLPETYFLSGADCQGWATWKRGWDLFEADGRKLLDELRARGLTREFDFGGAYPFTRMLKDQIEGRTSSWAIRWYASAFLKGKFTLYPRESLIRNIGFDGSGTHCSNVDNFNWPDPRENVRIDLRRLEIEESLEARALVTAYFRHQRNLLSRGQRYLKGLSRRLANTIRPLTDGNHG